MIAMHCFNWVLNLDSYAYDLSLNLLFLAQCFIISYHSYLKSKGFTKNNFKNQNFMRFSILNTENSSHGEKRRGRYVSSFGNNL